MLDTNGTNKKTQKKTAALLPPPAVTEGVVPWVMSVMQIYRKVAKFCKKKLLTICKEFCYEGYWGSYNIL